MVYLYSRIKSIYKSITKIIKVIKILLLPKMHWTYYLFYTKYLGYLKKQTLKTFLFPKILLFLTLSLKLENRCFLFPFSCQNVETKLEVCPMQVFFSLSISTVPNEGHFLRKCVISLTQFFPFKTIGFKQV